jgi:hypothetical protein
MTTNRRLFMLTTFTAIGGAAVTTVARAQARVDEKDPQALSLGYVADAAHADAKKFPRYAAGQNCAGCALYQGRAADAAGNCPLYAGKQVSAKGWCSAWVKKA